MLTLLLLTAHPASANLCCPTSSHADPILFCLQALACDAVHSTWCPGGRFSAGLGIGTTASPAPAAAKEGIGRSSQEGTASPSSHAHAHVKTETGPEGVTSGGGAQGGLQVLQLPTSGTQGQGQQGAHGACMGVTWSAASQPMSTHL